MRFYLIPGQGHGEGIFRHGHDWLATPKYTGPASPTQAQANDAANFTCTAH